ncbi:Alpha-1,3-mannosyltransferase-like protein [Ophidiomyces ophidiicola]|uniref:Alpha-1,3-mannosyltransferase-like protein n=1 Tax=Ophidiomyces ophidiicola TaxID=1387563 RepID=UPI0020C30EC5|nr:Alpha-1,3-mannosyltransferase-like protein [Ophidiomyces ophidiicola]KAI1949092.1 Alpha-1,3-mannosyltransferase-like protein [Ophidiomyces ophidiicola]KAI2055374.1 Alpha-1,3-mannosyltransferase-like protein [Ophidiomyces ophidiicola]
MPLHSRGSPPEPGRKNITIIHPDLGIGGAERLILDVALTLQTRGHRVTIYTSHRDPSHCFEEARDGTLDVKIRGNTIFPAHVKGRLHVLMAVLRQLHLVVELVLERRRNNGIRGDSTDEEKTGDDVFIIDQVPACVPVLRLFASDIFSSVRAKGRERILFYCHFPDQLLARRDEGSLLLRRLKGLYRYPFDWFEGWAMSGADTIVANSRFTCGVVKQVFGNGLGNVRVLYPCVDTSPKPLEQERGQLPHGEGPLWDGQKILLSINRFERKKNIELAIKSYHALGDGDRKGTRLVIAGGYDNRVQENVQYHRELDSLASSLGLQTATSKTVVSALSIPESIDVLFLLSVPSAFKQTLLACATLLLYTPSHEHFGIVPVEAMHAGLPVLAVNTGGPLETISEGETGWLRDGDSIEQWTEIIKKVLRGMDANELERMGKRGQERVEQHFSLRALGDRLEEEIGNMTQSPRSTFMGAQQIIAILASIGLGAAVLAVMALSVGSRR